MRYQVPQFIETETKLIGPLTLKQFMFIAGGVSVFIMEYLFIPNVIILVVLAIPTLGFFGGLAFFKVDGQPLLNYLAYVVSFFIGPKRYEYRPPADTTIH